MKRFCNKIHLVLILLLTTWVTPLHSATTDEYVGSWSGDVTVDTVGESESVHLLIAISASNGSLTGTVTDDNTAIPQPFQATVSNGNLIFQFPNMDPGNPDCSNWNLPATASLDPTVSIMHLTASGTICGNNGGKTAAIEGDLPKLKQSLQPILSILLKDKGTDWFFSGSDIGGNHTWYGLTTLNQSGKLLNGTLNSSSGANYTFVNGKLNTSSTGEVTGSLTDSDSTTTSFSMQLNGHKNIMAGKGKAVGESENGLFIFVKKSSEAQSTDLSDQWFLAYSDLVANRTCGGTITFSGLSGLENFRSATGAVECADGTNRTFVGGTLGSLVVNDPASNAPGNVVGTLQDASGTMTNLTMDLNEQEKFMAGYGKGASDTENGLYIFIKKTTGASTTDLAGDWFVSNSDLFGNRTWEGVFSFNNSGELTSGTLTSTNGDIWTFTNGSLSVDSSGQVTGTVTDTGSSITEFHMQIDEQRNIMGGLGFATSDQDNGLFVFVKK